jgi:hypothetical protein
MKISHLIMMGAVAAVSLSCVAPARAQLQASAGIREQASAMANVCLDNWQAPACLKAVSTSALVLAANYGTALQQGGHAAEAEEIKQHCAASTAATQGDYPAAAMKSAFTECANTVSDVAGKTGVNPDPSQYQLLVGPVMCLEGDPRCAAVTSGLKAFSGR